MIELIYFDIKDKGKIKLGYSVYLKNIVFFIYKIIV